MNMKKKERKKERKEEKRGKTGTRRKRFPAQELEAQRQTGRYARAEWSVMSSKSVEEDEEELDESFEDDDVDEEEPAT
jgi:hypothetical protein